MRNIWQNDHKNLKCIYGSDVNGAMTIYNLIEMIVVSELGDTKGRYWRRLQTNIGSLSFTICCQKVNKTTLLSSVWRTCTKFISFFFSNYSIFVVSIIWWGNKKHGWVHPAVAWNYYHCDIDFTSLSPLYYWQITTVYSRLFVRTFLFELVWEAWPFYCFNACC